jgi:hypothetical protein
MEEVINIIAIPEKINGEQFEILVFGVAAVWFDVQQFKEFDHAVQDIVRGGAVIEWNPRDPPTDIAKMLYSRVRRYLTMALRPKLELHCAIGTSLDIWHKTDAFFRVDNYIVSLDFTVDLAKKKNSKIILVHPRDINKPKRICRKIAKMFNEGIVT